MPGSGNRPTRGTAHRVTLLPGREESPWEDVQGNRPTRGTARRVTLLPGREESPWEDVRWDERIVDRMHHEQRDLDLVKVVDGRRGEVVLLNRREARERHLWQHYYAT